MAPAAHGHGQALLLCKGNGCDDVGRVDAAHDEGGMAIERAVPNAARTFIRFGSGDDELPVQQGL